MIKKMKMIWAIGIVVLLMCGGIMMTGAFSGTNDNNKIPFAVVFENLKFGSSPTQVKIVDAQNQRNLFDIFGIEEPQKVDLPDIRTYNESKDTIDKILDTAGLKNFDGEIVGLLEYAGFKILLIDQGDTVLEVAWDGFNISTYTLIPELLGSKEYPVSTKQRGDYTFSREKSESLHRLGIQIPSDSGPGVLYTHIVTVWHNGTWTFPQGDMVLHIGGKFYVDYGNEVEYISDLSYTETATTWNKCEFDHSTSGAGTHFGQVDAYAKWALNICGEVPQCDIEGWVMCDYMCNTDSECHGDKWMAHGCGCAAI